MNGTVFAVVIIALVLLVIIVVAKAIMVVPQAQSAVIERLGRFRTVASPGLTFLVPFLDKVRARIDLREQVVSFPPQPVITEDNLTVSIDTVVYFQVTDSRAAVYEISNYIVGVEQLTTTTLRNVVGGMSLEQTLTSRDSINTQLRGVLDEATGRWGIRVGRVEPGSCGHRVNVPRGTCRRRARRRRSRRCSPRSRRVARRRKSWHTSTCRPCRRWRRATRTRSG